MAEDFDEEFIEEISVTNPSTNVNDENINLPLLELQHNIKTLMNLIAGSNTSNNNFLSYVYGNLLDYNSDGQKIFFNGGNFDCFEKKHEWIAVNDGAVSNDTDIQIEGSENLLIYKGIKSYVDTDGEHGVYLQRDFYIPPVLRGSELLLAIKGTGVYLQSTDDLVPFDYNIPYCDDSEIPNVKTVGEPVCLETTPVSGVPTPIDGDPGITCTANVTADNCYARYEDIGIEILGASSTIQEIVTLGPWPHHSLYAQQNDWLPEYRTVFVPIKVGTSTSSIKIRIRRTRDDGAIALSQIFLGGLPRPFDTYDYQNFDINELYDFDNGLTKWNVTTVNGHHTVEQASTKKLPNLMTFEQWAYISQFERNIEEFDWDAESGPRPNELELLSDTQYTKPRTHGLEFDPNFTRYCYFDMRVNGPNPGLCYLGVSYFINENDFSDTISCDQTQCGKIKFKVRVAVVNPHENGNIQSYRDFGYLVEMPAYTSAGGLGYFEVYGNFYQDLSDVRGAIVYFIISREGANSSDTFNGNFVLVGCKTGIAVPPDDKPSARSYTNLFVGDNNEC